MVHARTSCSSWFGGSFIKGMKKDGLWAFAGARAAGQARKLSESLEGRIASEALGCVQKLAGLFSMVFHRVPCMKRLAGRERNELEREDFAEGKDWADLLVKVYAGIVHLMDHVPPAGGVFLSSGLRSGLENVRANKFVAS